MPGTVVKQAGPVSYKVETEKGVQRRHGDKKSESVQTEATAAATIERGYRHRRSCVGQGGDYHRENLPDRQLQRRYPAKDRHPSTRLDYNRRRYRISVK